MCRELKKERQGFWSIDCFRWAGLSGGWLLRSNGARKQMVMAVRQISRLGRQSMLGLKANGKLIDIILPYCKTFTLKNAGRKVLTLSKNSGFSSLFSALNKIQKIHYGTLKTPQTRLFQLGILACFLLVTSLLFGANLRVVYASEVVNIPLLADAIYKAEGGAKTRHPYGILKKYKTTTPRQACINTIKSGLKRYETSDKSLQFIPFLAQTYCPTVPAKGQKLTSLEQKLNGNWIGNVTHHYNRLLSKNDGALKSFTKHKAQNVNKTGGKNARV